MKKSTNLNRTLLIVILLMAFSTSSFPAEDGTGKIVNQNNIHANDSTDSPDREQDHAVFYGIRFQLYGKWEKVSDRDFPQGALLLNDGVSPDGSAFVSVIPENLLDGGPAELLNMKATGNRLIDGKEVTEYESEFEEENVHVLFLAFEELKYKNERLIIITFTPKQHWDSASKEIHRILKEAKVL